MKNLSRGTNIIWLLLLVGALLLGLVKKSKAEENHFIIKTQKTYEKI